MLVCLVYVQGNVNYVDRCNGKDSLWTQEKDNAATMIQLLSRWVGVVAQNPISYTPTVAGGVIIRVYQSMRRFGAQRWLGRLHDAYTGRCW